MKPKNAAVTLLTILNLNLGGGDTLKYSSDRLILPDFKVNYETNDYCSRIDMSLDMLLKASVEECEKENALFINEVMNENYTNYFWNKENNEVKWWNSKGEKGFLKADSEVYSIHEIISKALNNEVETGIYKVLVDETFMYFNLEREENDSLMTLKAPVHTDPFPLDQFFVTFKKKEGDRVFPVDIFIDMPWYLSFLDYNLEKVN